MNIRLMAEFLNTEHWLYGDAADYDTSDASEVEILGLGTGTGAIKPVAPARGLPPQCSAEVAHALDGSDVDRSHLLLSELLDYDWSQAAGAGRASDLPLRKYVDALRAWAGTKGLMPHEVRVVFGVVS